MFIHVMYYNNMMSQLLTGHSDTSSSLNWFRVSSAGASNKNNKFIYPQSTSLVRPHCVHVYRKKSMATSQWTAYRSLLKIKSLQIHVQSFQVSNYNSKWTYSTVLVRYTLNNKPFSLSTSLFTLVPSHPHCKEHGQLRTTLITWDNNALYSY